ncbi:hypothetical protein [Kitasatospora sp. NPDC090091]|uniref:hypothetical protein n=1 Tax=Kitasatospora sp. NPDC090091 TaxID=3364081 RepID=UPI00381309CD
MPKAGRPANSRVRHGMASCGEYGCTQEECVRAMRRARARQSRDRELGIGRSVPAQRARAHTNDLIMAGVRARDIAARAGLSTGTVNGIRRGSLVRVDRPTEEALLGVPVPRCADQDPRDRSLSRAPAIGTTRRLRALSARGFTVPALAGETGCAPQTLKELRAGNRSTTCVATVRRVEALFERWWNVNPIDQGVPSDRAAAVATYARKRMWAPPGCWDPETIDDPAGYPDWTGHCGTASGWLMHLVDGPALCPACAPQAVDTGSMPGPDAVRALAAACGPALLAFKEDRRGWLAVGRAVGLNDRQISDAHAIAKTTATVCVGGFGVAA